MSSNPDLTLRQAERAALLDPCDLRARAALARSGEAERAERRARARWARLAEIRRAADKQEVMPEQMPKRLRDELHAQVTLVRAALRVANVRLREYGVPAQILLKSGRGGYQEWELIITDTFDSDGGVNVSEAVRYDIAAQVEEWADALISSWDYLTDEAGDE